jgi:hypothetical protein
LSPPSPDDEELAPEALVPLLLVLLLVLLPPPSPAVSRPGGSGCGLKMQAPPAPRPHASSNNGHAVEWRVEIMVRRTAT